MRYRLTVIFTVLSGQYEMILSSERTTENAKISAAKRSKKDIWLIVTESKEEMEKFIVKNLDLNKCRIAVNSSDIGLPVEQLRNS